MVGGNQGVTLDSHSFAAQIKGEKGTRREWVYVKLNGKSYVRDARYRLTNREELLDLREAPFKEILVAKDTVSSDAAAARKKLKAILDEHPAGPAKPVDDAQKAAKKAKKAARRLNQ